MDHFRLEFTVLARRDIAEIRRWSRAQFGLEAARRYRDLIGAALLLIAADPHHPLVKDRGPELPGFFSFHLRHARGQVGRPRHLLFFVIDERQRQVTVMRLLHEAMDFERQLEGTTSEDD